MSYLYGCQSVRQTVEIVADPRVEPDVSSFDERVYRTCCHLFTDRRHSKPGVSVNVRLGVQESLTIIKSVKHFSVLSYHGSYAGMVTYGQHFLQRICKHSILLTMA